MKQKILIKDYIQNNELNIEDIIQNYTAYVYTILKNKNQALSDEDIEEVVSDVFLAIWKNKEKLDINRELSPYIAGIAKNLYNKKIINKKDSINIENYENILFETENIYVKIENKDKENLIMMIVNNMKEEDKNIFILYYYYSRSMKDISKIPNITENKVKSRLFRIRAKIKKYMKKRGEEL